MGGREQKIFTLSLLRHPISHSSPCPPCSLCLNKPKHEREESNPVQQFWRLSAHPGASLVCIASHRGHRDPEEQAGSSSCPSTPFRHFCVDVVPAKGYYSLLVLSTLRSLRVSAVKLSEPSVLSVAKKNNNKRKARESNPHRREANHVSTVAQPTVSGCLPQSLSVSSRSGSRTHKHQTLDLAALPICVLG